MGAGCLATTGIGRSRAAGSGDPNAKALATPATVIATAIMRKLRFFIRRLPASQMSPFVGDWTHNGGRAQAFPTGRVEPNDHDLTTVFPLPAKRLQGPSRDAMCH
jgi:hypothetical protein